VAKGGPGLTTGGAVTDAEALAVVVSEGCSACGGGQQLVTAVVSRMTRTISEALMTAAGYLAQPVD